MNNYKELETVFATWAADKQKQFGMTEQESSNIVCNVGPTEMLKVTPDGFYVRGVKVPQDGKETETVYNAFKAFLMWSRLNVE